MRITILSPSRKRAIKMSQHIQELRFYFSGLRWIILVFAMAFCSGAQAQSWRWTFEDVDVHGAQTSIIADKDGNLHLSYYVPDNFGELRYAFRSAAESRWYKDSLDQHLGEFSTGITLDVNDGPGICYTPRKLKYIHWTGHKWSPAQEVDPGSGLIAYHCSIKYTRADAPEITWYLESIFNLRYAVLEDGAWEARSVEVGTQSGKWNSLFLDQNDLPHVAYSSFKMGELHYAYFDGQGWVRNILDSNPLAGPRGMGASLVLDARGNPMISYHDLNSLKFAHFDGRKWLTETIEELPPYVDWSWKNFCTTILVDHNGNPHISYESHLLGLKHAWWDGKRWHTQLIRASQGASIFESSMTIDRNDDLYIAFCDPIDGSLKVAIGKATAVSVITSAGKKEDSKN